MKQATVCPACGARMRDHRKKCLRCGTVLPIRVERAAHDASWLGAHSTMLVALLAGGLFVAAAAVFMFQRPEAKPAPAGAPATTGAAAPSALPQRAPAQPTQAPPADPQVIGRFSYHDGDFEGAYNRYREAVDRNPNDTESMNNAAQMLVRLGRTAEALPLFERAIAGNDRRWAYHFNLAHACGLLNEWDRATAEYRVAADLFPNDFVTEFNLGMALHKGGDDAGAIDHFHRAIELAPDQPDFHLSLAISNERLGHTAEAIDGYRRYLEMAPASPEASKIRARVEMLSQAKPDPQVRPGTGAGPGTDIKGAPGVVKSGTS